MLTDEMLHAAIDRLARTDDGRTLYLFLQKRLMAIWSGTEDGALQADHGERRFAAKLIGLMAKGIADRDGSNTNSGNTGGIVSPEQPIVFAVARPRSTGGPRGARRRVTADTRVAGWDTDA